MRRTLVRVAAAIGFALAIAAGLAGWEIGRIQVEQVAERLYTMTGAGGNVGVLVTDAGVVVVDTMTFVRQGDAIRARIAELTDQPVVAVINTHYHLDHTHGNPAFEPGTRVVATGRTLEHLRTLDETWWSSPRAAALLPNETVEHERSYTFGNDTVRVVHPGRGHTDGDLVVLFERQRVLHAGDLFFHGHYPNIDLEAGGTIPGWIEALERVESLEFDGVIPGHGPFADRAALERFREFLRSLWTQTRAIADAGGSLEDAERRVDLSAFGLRPILFAPYLNRRFVIRRAFEEATAASRAP